MKKCFKCGQIKELNDFYAHRQMADGRLNKCKECTRSDVRKHRLENDSVREYDRRRFAENHNGRKERMQQNVRNWNLENPDGYFAHNSVSNAIRDGKLIRKPCEVCGSVRSHAHHDDYSKPLDVRWLCAVHHARHHALLTDPQMRISQ
jgi:hypothetical protein